MRTAMIMSAGSREVVMARVAVQRVTRLHDLPGDAMFRRWVGAALAGARHRRSSEIVIRLVNEAEGRQLNLQWRHRGYATNVLSFPAELPPGLHSELLGDLVICAPVVRREARVQHKPPAAHWAHLVVHGTLHLLGYDHESAAEAGVMESLETAILGKLGFSDPYVSR